MVRRAARYNRRRPKPLSYESRAGRVGIAGRGEYNVSRPLDASAAAAGRADLAKCAGSEARRNRTRGRSASSRTPDRGRYYLTVPLKESAMRRRIAGRWVAVCLSLAALAAGTAPAQNPTPPAPPAPVYPNFLVEVSKSFANRLVESQSQTVTTPINTN